MREYKIGKTNLWFGIFRQRKEFEETKEYRNGKSRDANKGATKTYIRQDEATSALAQIKIKEWKKHSESS